MTDIDALKALRGEVADGECSMHLAIAAVPKWSSLIMASFDGNLDAALALHDALLPGCFVAITRLCDVKGSWHLRKD